MGSCSECGEPIDLVSAFECHRCAGSYCSDHRLPENHACQSGIVAGDGKLPQTDGGSVLDWILVAAFLPFLAIVWAGKALLLILTLLLDVRVAAVLLVGVPVLLAGAVATGALATDDVPGAEPVVSGVQDIVEGPADGDDLNKTRVDQLVFEEVNDIREANGLPPLRHNSRADGVAQTHAEDMAEHDYVGHTSSQGVDQRTRYSFCGGGENVAQTWVGKRVETPSGGTTMHEDVSDVAAGIVEQWMNSRPHREDGIQGRLWTSGAVGVATSGDKVYVVFGFCLT